MENKTIRIHQGYYGEVNRAHSCIAQTITDPDLTSFLITFTDRPASLPPGVNLQPYLSGSPYSKYYVVTKTFPDYTASRAGMVFTHVLIFNLNEILLINSFEKILSLFVKDVEGKNDKIQELQTDVSDLTQLPKSNLLPKYVQQTISSFISGVKPILFSGDVLAFANVLQYIWNSPNIELRKTTKFRASFTPNDIQGINDLTIVSIQKDFFPKWREQNIILSEEKDTVKIVSPSELLFLGYHEENKFYNFLVDLHVDLHEAKSYKQYENLYQDYVRLENIEDANMIRQDIRLISKISPSIADGVSIKKKFIEKLVGLIKSKKDLNIKALRNIDWSAFNNGENIVKEIVSDFLTIEFKSDNDAQPLQILAEVINLSCTEINKNFWHDVVKKSVNALFIEGSKPAIKKVWQLIDFSEETLINLLSIVGSVKQCEMILLKFQTDKLKAATNKKLEEITQEKKWFLLHADILLKQTSIEKALEKQLVLERELAFNDAVGVRYLASKLTQGKILELCLTSCDKKLVQLSVEAICEDISLLKSIDLATSCWLQIWTLVVKKTKRVFDGLEGQEEKITYSIFDLITNGLEVDDFILELISNTIFSDLSFYENRKMVWNMLAPPIKERFLINTTKGALKRFLADEIEESALELPIYERITSDNFMSTFLYENRNNITAVIKVYESFKNLRDSYLSNYLNNYRGLISEVESTRLGNLIWKNRLLSSARSVYEKCKYNISFRPAYEICEELVSLTWWESIRGRSKKSYRSRDFNMPVASSENLSRKELPTVVILTAIHEEYRAVRNHLIEIVEADQNDTSYEAGIFEFNKKEVAKVIIRECGARNTTASQETERAIQHFQPDLMFFVGIAGSRKPNDFAIGDVIFPEKIYSYEGGKSEKNSFAARPDLAPLTYSIMEIAKKERRKDDWKMLIKGEGNKDVKADLGIIASGEQVVEHYDSEIGRILKEHFNDTSAVEMEGFGFAKAASRQGRNMRNLQIGIVRGISDIIEQSSNNNQYDSNSNHDRRPSEAKKVASDTAAAFAFWLILKALEDKESEY